MIRRTDRYRINVALVILQSLTMGCSSKTRDDAPASNSAAPLATCPAGMNAHPKGTHEIKLTKDEKIALGLSADGPATVEVKAFCLDTTEVTLGDYRSCVKGGKCNDEHLDGTGRTDAPDAKNPYCDYARPTGDRHPMNCVSWEQARGYCDAKGLRLPTAQEWEYAARGGGEDRRYPWGIEAPSNRACVLTLEQAKTAMSAPDSVLTCPVGSHAKGVSRWGAEDLFGNVQEWTSTSTCRDRNLDRKIVADENCKDLARIVIGAGPMAAADAEVSKWIQTSPVQRAPTVGFRCARDM